MKTAEYIELYKKALLARQKKRENKNFVQDTSEEFAQIVIQHSKQVQDALQVIHENSMKILETSNINNLSFNQMQEVVQQNQMHYQQLRNAFDSLSVSVLQHYQDITNIKQDFKFNTKEFSEEVNTTFNTFFKMTKEFIKDEFMRVLSSADKCKQEAKEVVKAQKDELEVIVKLQRDTISQVKDLNQIVQNASTQTSIKLDKLVQDQDQVVNRLGQVTKANNELSKILINNQNFMKDKMDTAAQQTEQTLNKTQVNIQEATDALTNKIIDSTSKVEQSSKQVTDTVVASTEEIRQSTAQIASNQKQIAADVNLSSQRTEQIAENQANIVNIVNTSAHDISQKTQEITNIVNTSAYDTSQKTQEITSIVNASAHDTSQKATEITNIVNASAHDTSQKTQEITNTVNASTHDIIQKTKQIAEEQTKVVEVVRGSADNISQKAEGIAQNQAKVVEVVRGSADNISQKAEGIAQNQAKIVEFVRESANSIDQKTEEIAQSQAKIVDFVRGSADNISQNAEEIAQNQTKVVELVNQSVNQIMETATQIETLNNQNTTKALVRQQEISQKLDELVQANNNAKVSQAQSLNNVVQASLQQSSDIQTLNQELTQVHDQLKSSENKIDDQLKKFSQQIQADLHQQELALIKLKHTLIVDSSNTGKKRNNKKPYGKLFEQIDEQTEASENEAQVIPLKRPKLSGVGDISHNKSEQEDQDDTLGDVIFLSLLIITGMIGCAMGVSYLNKKKKEKEAQKALVFDQKQQRRY